MMKKSYKAWAGAVVGIAVIVLIFFYFSGGKDEPGKYDAFAQCITDSEAAMYGAYWCPHCQDQKDMFGDSWKLINYVECDPRGNNANPTLCQTQGVTGYPTWIFGDGQRESGTLSLNSIASRTGCQLP